MLRGRCVCAHGTDKVAHRVPHSYGYMRRGRARSASAHTATHPCNVNCHDLHLDMCVNAGARWGAWRAHGGGRQAE